MDYSQDVGVVTDHSEDEGEEEGGQQERKRGATHKTAESKREVVDHSQDVGEDKDCLDSPTRRMSGQGSLQRRRRVRGRSWTLTRRRRGQGLPGFTHKTYEWSGVTPKT